ncbi:hypothetical protein [Streptomyces sp. NPDC002490]|uniref:hypothetical protein n=1 Tax=Streptomyces sp. NPDC002490 TaxID=3154416 RepID=UPI00331BB884
MGRRPRDRDRDAAAIKAAAERLLAGTPLRSASGKLTATELIVESGLRRDVVYPHHQIWSTSSGSEPRRKTVSPLRLRNSRNGTRPQSRN